ncbi:RNA-binding protein 4.1-like isoform 2-T3 [Pholidichthys leucotaenia]
MVKIFVGNVATDAKAKDLRELFEKYGEVTECDVLVNFGFVHMAKLSEAEEAIKNLHRHELLGWRLNVELSKGVGKNPTTKLHVGNLGEEVTSELLQEKFEEFGPVIECDIVKDYAFVHMERREDAMEAIDKLDNTAFKGKLMTVKLSTSRLRTAPGMGDHTGCFVCGKHGHWSKDCPVDRSNGYSDGTRGRRGRGPPGYGGVDYGMNPPSGADYERGSAYSRASYGGRIPPPPPPPRRLGGFDPEPGDQYGSRPAGSYPDRSSAYDRGGAYSSVDYYQKYRAYPYGTSYFEDRRPSYVPPPPPPSSSLSSSIAPYERRPLPPSTAAYYTGERSESRRAPATSAAYAYERARLSPVSTSRTSFALPRTKDHYAPRYTPY